MHADTILCAIELAPVDEVILRAGLEAADQLDASVHVVHVTNVLPMAASVDPVHGQVVAHQVTSALDAAERQMAGLLERTATGQVVVTREVRVGSPVPAIVEAARQQGADMIVIGVRGRTGIARLLDGNTAEQLIRATSVPVLCVPIPSEEAS